MSVTISPLLPQHWPRVAAIYQHGINTKIATFRPALPTWSEWDEGHTTRLVAEMDGDIAGWAALSPAYDRGFYWGVQEDSIYIDPAHAGKGVGKALLHALIAAGDAEGFWSLEARIIRENEASLALHKACGFREVGLREAFGRMDTGIWHDVVFLEYRSRVNGLN